MDIWDYFLRMEREIRDRCGYLPDDAIFEENKGTKGSKGTLRARIWLQDDAYFDLYEVVEIIDESHAHRTIYSYTLIVEGMYEHGWERDLNHPEMPLHEHDGEGRRRIPSGRVTLAEAVELAWERLSSRELAPWTDSE